VRRYAGNESYKESPIGQADDVVDADGDWVLNFWQAQERARAPAAAPERQVGPYRVKDAVRDYLDHLDGRASLNDTKLRLHAYALPVVGDKRVEEITAKDLRTWHRHLATAPRRVRTKRGGNQKTRAVDLKDAEAARKRKVSANRILGLLKAALNFAFAEGKVASDLEWRRVAPFPKVNRSRATFLQAAECKRLLNACDPDFRLLVRGALETGARYSELGRLRVADFDRDNGTIYFNIGKSGDSRHVILTEDGQSFFADLVAGRAGTEMMFGREWAPSQQARPMRAACERAKINPPVGFHQLRHTWASLAIKAGIPMPIVARNLGHADTRMTERHYAHLAEDHVTQTIRERAPRFGKVVSSKVRPIR
jgi:integrase